MKLDKNACINYCFLKIPLIIYYMHDAKSEIFVKYGDQRKMFLINIASHKHKIGTLRRTCIYCKVTDGK